MITSVSNPQIRQIAGLQSRAKLRREQGLFVVEGQKMVEELPEDRRVRVFAAESYAKQEKNKIFLKKFSAEIVPDIVFRHISDTQTPQGILAVARQRRDSMDALFSGGPILVLESIQDPGNLGTMLRTGEGAGIAGILANRETVDLYNPKVVRSTMGSIFRVPYVVAESLPEALKGLKNRGFSLFAAHLRGEKSYTDVRYGAQTAFLIGNEGNGLSDEVAGLADEYIRIPMEGKVESLNAAIAATLLIYEWRRQSTGEGKAAEL